LVADVDIEASRFEEQQPLSIRQRIFERMSRRKEEEKLATSSENLFTSLVNP